MTAPAKPPRAPKGPKVVFGIPTKGRPKLTTVLGVPVSERHKRFCERYLIHFDHVRAYGEAGFKHHRSQAPRAAALLARFSAHLQPLKDAKARVVAERIVIQQEDVLRAMASKAIFNPADFIEYEAEPIKDKVYTDEKTGKKIESPREVVRTFNGRPVFGARQRPFNELTREQQLSVEIVSFGPGPVTYRLPDIREQHLHLTSIGRQLGLFHERLILERHNHRHAHAHLHLEDVPTEHLQRLNMQLLPLVGDEYAQQLGFTKEEMAEARRLLPPIEGKAQEAKSA